MLPQEFITLFLCWHCGVDDNRYCYSFSVNGSHSPLSLMNGRTPSPSALVNSSMSQQLPPACGARQLSKLKRFLTTLQQFGSDISPDIGERVRTLVLGLVVCILLLCNDAVCHCYIMCFLRCEWSSYVTTIPNAWCRRMIQTWKTMHT